MLSVFDFDDYRKFLKEYYLRGRGQSALSLSRFAASAGLGSPNYLKLVFDGKRNLTNENIFLFAKALKLSNEELVYFESLVHFCQAKHDEAQNFYSRRLLNAKEKKSTSQRHSPKGIVAEWFYPACAVAAHNRTLDELVEFMRQVTGIRPQDTLSAVEKLMAINLLSIGEKDKFELIGNFATIHDPKHLDYSQERYLQDQLDISRKHFKRQYRRGTGKYISHTMTSPANGVFLLRDDFIELLAAKSKEFDDLSAVQPKLLQVNIQIFEVQN